MQAVLAGLTSKSIMRHDDIFILRDYIGRKYPYANIKERSTILANTVHSIIDRHLQEFDERYRSPIRISIMQKAVLKSHYAIHAGDIFRACIFS